MRDIHRYGMSKFNNLQKRMVKFLAKIDVVLMGDFLLGKECAQVRAQIFRDRGIGWAEMLGKKRKRKNRKK